MTSRSRMEHRGHGAGDQEDAESAAEHSPEPDR
jgi:hypothetical protein